MPLVKFWFNLASEHFFPFMCCMQENTNAPTHWRNSRNFIGVPSRNYFGVCGSSAQRGLTAVPMTDCSSAWCSRSSNRIFHLNRKPSAQPFAKYCHSLKIVPLPCKQQKKCFNFLFYFFPQNFQCKLQPICELFFVIP